MSTSIPAALFCFSRANRGLSSGNVCMWVVRVLSLLSGTHSSMCICLLLHQWTVHRFYSDQSRIVVANMIKNRNTPLFEPTNKKNIVCACKPKKKHKLSGAKEQGPHATAEIFRWCEEKETGNFQETARAQKRGLNRRGPVCTARGRHTLCNH
ncbi:hypothetical protein TW95_gp0106 [Pandoravirus inopinatum]|uniref:Uncharacterized protein n=1 Tax=Pandoravirus inopinatum TaxID=1605721 RepID=A0A0B5J5C1_9VIRU|nr:hypothetical protein TW95_gp0106 [Pandoravirus inopinatum]AJF96840.1 hypothetical protein [Pandoravirus inopinatum]